MPDYKSMYHKLFKAITDSIIILQAVQLETEDKYMAHDENNPDNDDDNGDE